MTLIPYQKQIIPTLFRDFFGPGLPILSETNEKKWYPEIDVYEEDGMLHLDAEIPGINKDDVKVAYKEGVLTISGERKEEEKREGKGYFTRERRHGAFARSFRIGDGYEVTQIKATYKDGILKIQVPRKEETQPVNIVIQ